MKKPGITLASRITASNGRGLGTAGDDCGVPGSVVGSVTVGVTGGEAWGAGVAGPGTGPGGEVGGAGCFCAEAAAVTEAA